MIWKAMGHRPYRDRSTADLRLDRNFWWGCMTSAETPEQERFYAFRLNETEQELRHRGEFFKPFRAPPAREPDAPA